MKKQFGLLFIVAFASVTAIAQSGQKWSVSGNDISGGEFIGTTNNAPLILKTNNTTTLKLDPNGHIKIVSLEGFGNGLVSMNNEGVLTPFPFNGNTKQVLLGDGTWGSVPVPDNYWKIQNDTIFTLTPGNVGIGTSVPEYKLDVHGSVRITNDLYVGGGIIITDKVRASGDIKSASLEADSIIMDSTKAIYGDTRFASAVKIDNKLEVNGSARIFGGLRVSGLAINPLAQYLVADDGQGNFCRYEIHSLGDNLGNHMAQQNIVTGDFWISNNGESKGIRINPGGDLTLLLDGVNSFEIKGNNGVPLRRGISLDEDFGGVPNGRFNFWINAWQDAAFNFMSYVPSYMGSPEERHCLMTILKNGNVGIGSSIPQRELEIKSSGHYFGNTLPIIENTGTGAAGIEMIPGGGSKRWYIHATGPDNYQGGNKLVFRTTDSLDVMIVDESGNIGIGINPSVTNNPKNYRLAVNGTLGAKEIYVEINQTPWPDFVFNENYDLMALSELEAYLTENKHLPGIPSAGEINQNGISLGEMDAMMLKKIEELTLYIIEQNKTILSLQNEINELKDRRNH